MARIETRYETGGLNQALQYIQDMRPQRVRAYICTQAGEIVIRPRVTSQNSDTMIVRGCPQIGECFSWVLKSGIPREYCYLVDSIEWSDDRASTSLLTKVPKF